MDGDNAIQALAQKVEDTLKGTGTSSARVWSAKNGVGGVFGAAAWTAFCSVTLTGAPVGAVVALLASAGMSPTTATALAQVRLVSAGATIVPSLAAPKVNQNAGNFWSNLAVFGLATITVAAPTVNVEGYVNTGTVNVDAETHIIALRIV
jgi:hypothetical protein